MNAMTSNAKKTISAILVVSMLLVLMFPLVTSVSAATILSGIVPVKTYTLSTSRVTTFVNLNGAVSGYIDGATDLCTIRQIFDNGWVAVEYPVSNGGMKIAYAKLSDFIANVNFQYFKVNLSKNMTVYRRSNLSQNHGEVWTTDTVYVVSATSNASQIIYNVSGGWKLGWINETFNQSTSNNSATVFLQNDSRWKDTAYGYSDTNGKNAATLKTAGCGILSLTNAVYALSGCFVKPEWLASVAVEKGYRINGVGTSHSLYQWFCDAYGSSFNVKLSGNESSFNDEVKKHIKNGGVAIVSVPNHLMVINAYDTETGKYLILDSYPSSNRGTSETGYAWVNPSEFSSGSLKVSAAILMAKNK